MMTTMMMTMPMINGDGGMKQFTKLKKSINTLFDLYLSYLYFTLANGTTIDINRANDDHDEA